MRSAHLFLLAIASPVALAETANDFLAAFVLEASRENPGYVAPSPRDGERFFTQRHGREWSCSSCHTRNPAATGKHAVTGKIIEPLAPSANPARFTRASKVEKWFRRNCNDVLGRPCSAQEKADILAWLLSLK